MNNSLFFLKIQRSLPHPVYNDYIFIKDKSVNESVYYKCKQSGCKSRLILINNEISKIKEEHKHPSNKIEILKQLAINEIKYKVYTIYGIFIFIFISNVVRKLENSEPEPNKPRLIINRAGALLWV